MLFNLLFKKWEMLKNMSLTRQGKRSNWEIKSSFFSLLENYSFEEKKNLFQNNFLTYLLKILVYQFWYRNFCFLL